MLTTAVIVALIASVPLAKHLWHTPSNFSVVEIKDVEIPEQMQRANGPRGRSGARAPGQGHQRPG